MNEPEGGPGTPEDRADLRRLLLWMLFWGVAGGLLLLVAIFIDWNA